MDSETITTSSLIWEPALGPLGPGESSEADSLNRVASMLRVGCSVEELLRVAGLGDEMVNRVNRHVSM